MAEDRHARGERTADAAGRLLTGLADKALRAAADKVSHKIDETAHGLMDKAGREDGGGPGVQAAMSGLGALSDGKGPIRAALSAGMAGLTAKLKGGGGKKKLKLTAIVETIDVGVPVRLAYDQWTRFEDFPTFMKKVEHAEQPEDGEVRWKAQVFWSHREWESTIVEQVPDSHIIWRSKGAKGHADGAVSFTGLGPNLTRICLVMEYHPQGLFERTGNLWRAQGRRARLELKHFARHVMVHALADPDEVEGWRGEIRDGEVVRTGEEAAEEEQERAAREERGERPRRGHEEQHEEHRARPRRAPEEHETAEEHEEHFARPRRATEQEMVEEHEEHKARPRRAPAADEEFAEHERRRRPPDHAEHEPAEEREEREPRRIRRRPPAESARQPARRRPADAEDRSARTKQPTPRTGR